MAQSDQSSSDALQLRKHGMILARLGEQALRSDDLDALLQLAAELAAEAVDADFVKVLQLLPDGNSMLVRAGVNWTPGVVGHATISAHEHSPGGYALMSDTPVIANDLAGERRFEIPELLIEHGVTSTAHVPIGGRESSWGVLAADSRQGRAFDEDDLSLLRNCANLLAAAIERLDLDAELAVMAEQNRRLLQELEHRANNLIANVLALTQRTRAVSADPATFVAAFEGRLRALLRTQRLLTRGAGGDVSIWTLLRDELQAHGAQEGDHVELSGPDLLLPPNLAQALGMGFHELATNASKHGALTRTGARINVSWTVTPTGIGDELQIRWRETGVQIQGTPSRRSFGSDTIERILPAMLAGSCFLKFHPDGIECTIRFTLSQA